MSKTVLLVDDSRVARMMARRVVELAHADWTIVEAASGEEALEHFARAVPDFVLLDVNMPGIDGLETARRMKAIRADACISLLTANIQEPVRLQAQDIGVQFMNKPLRDEIVLAFLATGKVP